MENILVAYWMNFLFLLVFNSIAAIIIYKVRRRFFCVASKDEGGTFGKEMRSVKNNEGLPISQSGYFAFLRWYINAAIVLIVFLFIITGSYVSSVWLTKKPFSSSSLCSLLLFVPLLILTLSIIFSATRTSSRLILIRQDETKSNVK